MNNVNIFPPLSPSAHWPTFYKPTFQTLRYDTCTSLPIVEEYNVTNGAPIVYLSMTISHNHKRVMCSKGFSLHHSRFVCTLQNFILPSGSQKRSNCTDRWGMKPIPNCSRIYLKFLSRGRIAMARRTQGTPKGSTTNNGEVVYVQQWKKKKKNANQRWSQTHE